MRDAVVLSTPPDVEPVVLAALDEDDGAVDDEYPELGREDDDESASAEEEWADAVPGPMPPRAQVVLWLSHGTSRVWLPEPPEALLLDPGLAGAAIARWERLGRYAEQIRLLAPATLAAASLREAYDVLRPLPATAVAEALGVHESRLSEDRDVLVRIPAGLVPLSFFTSKNDNDRVVCFLWAQPDLLEATKADLGRRAAAELGGRSSAHTPYVEWLRVARRAPGVLRAAAARFARDPRDAKGQAGALQDALEGAARALGSVGLKAGRGSAVAERALYGGLR